MPTLFLLLCLAAETPMARNGAHRSPGFAHPTKSDFHFTVNGQVGPSAFA
jgi:hypothetical protein